MEMEMKDIEAFINLAKKEGVSSLKYESKDIKISVTLPDTNNPASQRHNHLPEFPEYGGQHFQNYQNFQNTDNGKVPSKMREGEGLHKITSPFVGTFYTSPSPGENAYVKVGDRVKKGQILCIVEAMKIMNEIDSDVAGEVMELCVENESLVEYGQILYLIKV